MASWLPEELFQDILVRLPLDEPVHLARSSVVCKAWRRVLSDRDNVLRRCHEFHGGALPLLGFIENKSWFYFGPASIQFVPANSVASPVRLPAIDLSGSCALDCRHGRVLIHAYANKDTPSKRLFVWDPITGRLHRLSVPDRYSSYKHYYVGAVLCAKDDVCDHLNCHDDGPFLVVVLENKRAGLNVLTCASIVYSSETNTWSPPISNGTNRHLNCHAFSSKRMCNLLIGDSLYFPFENDNIIIKYDLRAHSLSEIDMPRMSTAILMKAEDGGLGLASLWDNCIYLWSRQDFTDGVGEWVQYRVMELVTLLGRCIQNESYKAVGFVEGTSIIFIHIPPGIFIIDLKSNKTRQVVGKREDAQFDPILPYTSFYVPW